MLYYLLNQCNGTRRACFMMMFDCLLDKQVSLSFPEARVIILPEVQMNLSLVAFLHKETMTVQCLTALDWEWLSTNPKPNRTQHLTLAGQNLHSSSPCYLSFTSISILFNTLYVKWNMRKGTNSVDTNWSNFNHWTTPFTGTTMLSFVSSLAGLGPKLKKSLRMMPFCYYPCT